jgi:hypothetical protein
VIYEVIYTEEGGFVLVNTYRGRDEYKSANKSKEGAFEHWLDNIYDNDFDKPADLLDIKDFENCDFDDFVTSIGHGYRRYRVLEDEEAVLDELRGLWQWSKVYVDPGYLVLAGKLERAYNEVNGGKKLVTGRATAAVLINHEVVALEMVPGISETWKYQVRFDSPPLRVRKDDVVSLRISTSGDVTVTIIPDGVECLFVPSRRESSELVYPLGGGMTGGHTEDMDVPDYTDTEPMSYLSANNGEWKTDRDGFVRIRAYFDVSNVRSEGKPADKNAEA